jgi:two-component system, OmpR family, sensor histidine kinase VicK
MFAKLLGQLKLHTKFIVLLICASLMPLLIVLFITQTRFQSTLRTDASQLGQQLAATASAEIKSFIVSQLRILDNIAALYQPEFPIRPEIAAQLLENILFRSENFSDITVVDGEGREIARKNRRLVLSGNEKRDLSGFEGFETVRQRGLYVGPVMVESGRPFFTFGIEILNARGEFVGAVFAEVDARIMPRVVGEISQIVGPPGRVYIVDDEGIVIAHPDLSYVLAQKDLSALPTVRQVVEAPETIGISAEYTNEQGLDVLGSAHAMTIELFDSQSRGSPSIDWYVVAEQPADVVYRDARQAAYSSMFISLAAVILAALAAFYFAGRISRPIESLHTAALQFGQGNLGHRAPIESGDEIGDLARSFNTMAETIGKTMLSLRREEEVVKAERNKLSLILGGITNAVVAVDTEGKIVLFNKAAEALVGFSADQVLGKQASEVLKLFEGEREVPVDEFCPSASKTTEGVVYSKTNLRMPVVGEKEHIVNLVSGRIREGLSIHLGCVLTFQDITKEYAIERMKREFVSIAAHQLRTPLTGMKWAVDFLLTGEKGNLSAEQKSLASQALEAVNRMIHLVNDLLDVNRVEEGKFGIHAQRQSIVPLLDRIVGTYEQSAAKKGVEFKALVARDIPELVFDSDKIEIVLSNLLDNAIKYTPAGGKIYVNAEPKGGSLVISVQDSGIGIPHDDADRIFTKFFRSSQAYLHHTDGSGLGLYVAKNIIDQHGGDIWFESAESAGTTFYVSLPLEAKAIRR